MEVETYFFDTYALYEITHANQNYSPYMKNVKIITTKLNIMELHYIFLRLYGKEKAEQVFDRFSEFCIEIEDAVIKEANEFKFSNREKNLSYVDCISYCIARKFKVKFLTGDKEFKEMEGVEFVK